MTVSKVRIFKSPEQLSHIPSEYYVVIENHDRIAEMQKWYEVQLKIDNWQTRQILDNQWNPTEERTILVEMDAQ